MRKITPCLWFDERAEEAANHYVSVFNAAGRDSKVLDVSHYGEDQPRPAGTVMVVDFELDGQRFQALNAGPEFTFSPAISFSVECANQEEVDHFWDSLIEGGAPSQCGWLEDKFGLSWQIIPRQLPELLADPDPARAQRAMQAMLKMIKIDISELQRAADAG